MIQAVALLHLRHSAVQHTASARRGQDAVAALDVRRVNALVVGVALVVADNVNHAAQHIKAGDSSSARRELGRLHDAHLIAAVIQQADNLGIADNHVGNVRRAYKVRRRQAALGQQTHHSLKVSEDFCGALVPLDGRRVGCRIAALSVIANLHLVALVGVVRDMLHNAAVGLHHLGAHPLLAAGNALAQVLRVPQQHSALPLLGGQRGHERLAESALAQVVNGEHTARGDVGRRITLHLVALAQYGNAALAGRDERGELLAAIAVLYEHVGGGKYVGRVVGREITVSQEARRRRELLNRHEQSMGVVKIERHDSVLPVS